MLKKYKQSVTPLSAGQMKTMNGGAKTPAEGQLFGCRNDWDCPFFCNGNNPIGYYCFENYCVQQTCEPV